MPKINVKTTVMTAFGKKRWPTRGPTRPKAQAQPSLAQPGPSPAQARPRPAQARPKPGPGQISEDLEIWIFGIQQQFEKYKISKSKSVLPKMSARSGLVGKNNSWPHLGPFQAIFSMGPKNAKNNYFFAYFPWLSHALAWLQVIYQSES